MVDNLLKVFEKATEKYLDQISSSDDEIAVEFSSQNSDKTKATKSEDTTTTTSRRKPMLAAQTDKKRTRSISERSLSSSRSSSFESIHSEFEEERKSAVKHKHEKAGKVKKGKLEMVDVKKEKLESKLKKMDVKKEKLGSKKEPAKGKPEIKKEKLDARKEKVESKPEKLSGSSSIKENMESVDSKKDRAEMKKGKKSSKHDAKKTKTEDKPKKVVKAVKKPKKKVISRSPSRSISRSPPPSDSPPPSWPPSSPDSSSRVEDVTKNYKKRKVQELSDSEEVSRKGPQTKYSYFDDFFEDFEESMHQTKKLKSEEPLLSPKPKDKHNKLRETIEKLKAKSEMKLNDFQFELDHPKENRDNKNKKYDKDNKNTIKSNEKPLPKAEIEADSNSDSMLSESKKSKKIGPNSSTPPVHKTSNMEALSIATEQTLKDINKWLDDTPKFAEFSSASNSPSYTGLDEFDNSNKPEQIPGKKPPLAAAAARREPGKDPKKKTFRDPAKFFKRREIQRTIDRLQPGKGKGNLISNVQNPASKADEMFPLGPLSKHHKDPKNSLIVKTDTNAPKLSLGSVLNSFGKHKFVDDQKKEVENVAEALPAAEPPRLESTTAAQEAKEGKVEAVEDHAGGATPNLSAWFKAFGAPKPPPPPKKPEEKPEEPSGQRQRRVSTGSSVSERSSFSQDLDSPRVGIDERGAYPAPYPSPMHGSPSASPRPDISPKAAAYPTINGQIRVGFYQDTVSDKSSPEKSENSPSPYPHYSENVYTPNTTENAYYGYPNSAYYTHAPNYSTTNPTPPYNHDGSTTHNYTANSPLSNQSSPAPPQQHSPTVSMEMPPNSPGVYSQHSPTIHNSPAPSLGQQNSPSVQLYQSQEEQGKLVMQQGSPDAVFPAKKRAYDDEVPPLGDHKYRIDAKLSEKKDKPYIQNVPDPKAMSLQASGGYPASYDAEAFKQPKMDLSDYMNMGYTGPDVGYTRSLQFGSSEMSFTTASTQQMGYKGLDIGGNPQQAHSNTLEASRGRNENIGERLSQIQDVSTVNAARYNVSHMVDRFTTNDDRMMASYYTDKGLGTSHLFNKQMGGNGAMFSQANMAAVQSYNQNVQSNTTAAMFGRQMSELQSSVAVQNEMKVSQQQMQVAEKKSKKRKGKSVATISSDNQQPNVPAAVQGFQSYAGLKANPPIEPGAISLKTSSVVPGSAFNFGPSAASLGLYGDKDGYPNFLDEFRSAPNYYMAAAAAAHHRATPDGGDKQSRPAHQNSNPQTNPAYPFLGAPQARTSYPLGSPFMPNAQAQLMDTNPSIYQHYLQAGLLGAHGAYPPGYHPLGMRQPYDPMTRPSWL